MCPKILATSYDEYSYVLCDLKEKQIDEKSRLVFDKWVVIKKSIVLNDSKYETMYVLCQNKM